MSERRVRLLDQNENLRLVPKGIFVGCGLLACKLLGWPGMRSGSSIACFIVFVQEPAIRLLHRPWMPLTVFEVERVEQFLKNMAPSFS